MISLLENGHQHVGSNDLSDEDQLINLIYSFANKKDEWFNLLLSLSNCISLSQSLPKDHPYQDISERLLAHLKNAIKISTRLNSSAKAFDNVELEDADTGNQSSRAKRIKAASILNHIPIGAGIIDETGRVVEINQRARDLIENSTEWQLQHNYLQAQYINLTGELESLTSSDTSFISVPFNKNQEQQTKNRKNEDKHIDINSIHITTIPNQEPTNSDSAESNKINQQFYFCFHTSKPDLVCTNSLKQHYQLTETEALVVATLVQEVSSQKVATKLKLKEATIRGHLSSIYLKFNVKRKPELIRIVLLHSLFDRPKIDINGHANLRVVATNNEQSSAIYLRDGRKLSYTDHKKVGQPGAKTETILLLHNVMGSGLELPPGSEQLLTKLNIRIIIPERPGYGDSDPHPNRTHKDWCNDVEELLNTLKVDKIKVIAHSIGGVYALALAEFLPDRVERIAMVNTVTRQSDMREAKPVPVLVTAVFQSIRFAPFLLEPIFKMAVGKSIEHFYEQQLSYIRPTEEGRAADINLLKTQRYREYSISNLKQSAKQGISIWANELKLSFSELCFEVTNTEMEYQFWHGDHDDVVSVHAALRLARDVNTQKFNRITNETHFLFSRHFNQVVEQLIFPDTVHQSSEIYDDTLTVNVSQSIPSHSVSN